MNRPKVLIVDDEEIFAQNMCRLLNKRGYDVTAVHSGHAAIVALEGKDFEVMVLDLKMPGMDGMMTLQAIKKLGLFVDTLILTGHGSIDIALEALKLGAYDYLTKPCAVEQLVTKVDFAVRNRAPGLEVSPSI